MLIASACPFPACVAVSHADLQALYPVKIATGENTVNAAMVTRPYRFADDMEAPSSVGGRVIRALEKLARHANIRFEVMAATKLSKLKFISAFQQGGGYVQRSSGGGGGNGDTSWDELRVECVS